jgi:hypothetical protein
VEYCIMCAVISSLIHRLFSSFVLICFLWTTFFQTIAFADYTRAQPDPVLFDVQGDVTYAHLNVGIQKMERAPLPAAKRELVIKVDATPLAIKQEHDITPDTIAPALPVFIIPMGKTQEETQRLIDQAFATSELHEKTTVVEGGLTWTSSDLNFYRYNSGDILVSSNSTVSDYSDILHLYNYNGSSILDDNVPFEHLILSGKDVIQRGNRSINTLSLCIDGTFVNKNFLSVSNLLFSDPLYDSATSSHATCFANESTFIAHAETKFGIAHPIFNRGSMHFENDVILREDSLQNEDAKSMFSSAGKIKGTLNALNNKGTLKATKGFADLRIAQFSNENGAKIQGSGRLIVGAKGLKAINEGEIESDNLALHLEGDFYNHHRIQADELFQTSGKGTFHQRGILDGRKAFIDNTHFENEVSLDCPQLDLVLGANVTTFHNHHQDKQKNEIALRLNSLTVHKTTSKTSQHTNSGSILTNHFDNSAPVFTNEGQIETTSWTQHGTAFTNAEGSSLDVKDTTHFDTTLLTNNADIHLMGETNGHIQHLKNKGGLTIHKQSTLTIDEIDNTGILTVSESAITAETIRNTQKMSLLDGVYTCKRLENKTGEATIDQLSMVTDSPILEGKLTVHHFKATHERYKNIQIDGDVTLASGGFITSELTIKGTLTLGKGHYHIDRLKGDKTAKLILQRGTHVTIDGVEYNGDIVSVVSLELNPFKEAKPSLMTQLREDHAQRKTAFNAIPTAEPTEKPKLEETVYTKSQSIIDTQSDYNRINPDLKPCDLTELKSRLQSTIGTEVTRLIHNARKRETIDFQKTLPVLPQTDRLYKHFEIFRRTSKAARDIIEKITTDGMDILDSLSFYVPSFDTDFNTIHKYRYDLTRDMFMLWLKEVLVEHDEGFTPYKFLKPRELPPVPSAPTSQTGSYLTYCAPNSKAGDIETLQKNHNERQNTFNSLPTTKTEGLTIKHQQIYNISDNILRVLGRVSSKAATFTEKKDILQTVMGSQITRVIHSEAQQNALDPEENLPVVAESHWAYRHFEILRLTAKLSKQLVQQVYSYGYDVLNYLTTCIPTFETDHELLCEYSGLQREMFMLWFKDVFEKHKKGFPETTASLTFLSRASGQSANINQLKSIKTDGSLILKTNGSSLPEESVSSFLSKHKHILDIVQKDVLIDSECFSNTEPLDLPYSVLFRVKAFQPRAKLTVKGIRLSTDHLKLGSDNAHMVTVISNGPLHAIVEYDTDVRYGLLQSTKRAYIQSNSGKILIGARKNLDGNGNVIKNDSDAITIVKNGAMITSNEELILKVLRKSIINNFGVAHGSTFLQYSAPKLENTSAEGTSDGKIIVDVDDLSHLILDEIYHYGTGRSGADGGTQNVYSHSSYRGFFGREVKHYKDVSTYSSITGQKAKAESSMFSAKGDILINSKNPPNVFASHFASNGSIWWRHQDGYLKEVPNGSTAVVTLGEAQVATFKTLSLHDYFSNGRNAGVGHGCITPTFASAQGVNINFSRFNMLLEAAMSGKHITLTARGMQIVNRAGFRKPTKQTATLINVKQAADALYEHAPLTHKRSKDGTTHYTRNVPGDHPATYMQSIAVLPTKTSRIPRSLLSNQSTHPFTGHHSRPNVVFDDATLEQFLMHTQLNVTGRINEKGAGFLAYIVQNGHKFATLIQHAMDSGEAIDENALMEQIKEPALFSWPQGAMDIVTAFFPANMNMPYAGTSGNIQASDRVEVLADSDGIHEDGATIGSGKGGIHYKTENKGNRTAKSQTRRTYNGLLGHTDSIAVSNLSEANEGDIIEDIDGAILLTGAVDFEAGKGTSDPHKLILKGKEGVFGIETTLEQHSVEHISRGKVRGTVTETITRPVTAGFKSSGTTLITSANSKVYLAAPTFDAPLGTIVDGKLGAELGEVHSTHSRQENLRKEGNGFTTQSKNIQHTKQESRSSGATAKRGSVLVRSDEGDATVTNVQIDDLTLEAANGLARVLLGTNYFSEQEVITGKSKVRQSVSSSSERHDTFTESKIKNLAIKQSIETVVQSVQGRIPEFMQRIQNDGGKLTYDFVNEIHESTHFEHENLVPEAALVMSLAAAIATYGACSWIGGYAAASAGMTTTTINAAGATVTTLTTAGSISAGMISAGLNALTSQAIVTLASNKGDMDKTLKDLNKSDTFKSIAVAMSVAGLVGGGSLKNASLAQHLTHQAIRMSAQMGVESAIHGRTDGKSAALTAIASSLCGYFSNQIGSAYTKGDFGYFTHKFLHALSGAAGGAIIDGKEGAIAGAVGAAGVEVIADFMSPTGGMANDPNRPHYTEEQIQRTKDAARFTVILLGLAAGLNAKQLSVELALATVAIENNFEQSAKSLKDGSKEVEDEEAEISLLGHLKKTTGDFDTNLEPSGRLSPTSFGLHQTVKSLEQKVEQASGLSKFLALNELYASKEAFEERQQNMQTNKRISDALRYTIDHPLHAAAYGAGGSLMIGSIATRTIPKVGKYLSMGMGAAGSFFLEYANRDFQVNTQQGLIEISTSTALGALTPFSSKVLLPAGLGVAALGYGTNSTQMKIEGGAVALLSVVPFVREIRATNKINISNAHVMSAPDDIMLRPAANSNNPLTANLDRMSVPHTLMEASEVNGWQHLTQQFRGGSSDIARIPTTMSSSASKSIIPAKDSIITYGHVQDSTGKLIEAAVGIKGKESGILSLTKPKTGLLEGANEASAAYKRVQANMASPTSIASDSLHAPVVQSTTREQLFGTNSVATIDGQRVRPINGRQPINSEYAGRIFEFDESNLRARIRNETGIKDETSITGLINDYRSQNISNMHQDIQDVITEFYALKNKYPQGLPFTGNGFPDFSQHAIKRVQITFSGDSAKDIRLANKLSGYKSTPQNLIWHHNHDAQTMYLIPKDIHNAVRHTGGDAIIRSFN